MGPFATAIAVGCLDALRWLLWLVAVLLAALILVQYLRGDEEAKPLQFFIMAIIGGLAGWICGFASKYIAAARG